MTLDESVRAYLGLGDDGAAIDWDSLRREDGRWLVTATVGGRRASWTYDVVGTSVQPLDDDARAWMGLTPASDPIEDALGLIAETPVVRADAEVETLEGEETRGPDRPRLVAVPSLVEPEGIPDGEAPDADEFDVDESDVDESDVDESDVQKTDFDAQKQRVDALIEQPPLPLPQDPSSTVIIETAPEPAKPRKAKARKGRASVPSWDEILFGARSDD